MMSQDSGEREVRNLVDLFYEKKYQLDKENQRIIKAFTAKEKTPQLRFYWREEMNNVDSAEYEIFKVNWKICTHPWRGFLHLTKSGMEGLPVNRPSEWEWENKADLSNMEITNE